MHLRMRLQTSNVAMRQVIIFSPKIGKCQESCSEQIVQFCNSGIAPFATAPHWAEEIRQLNQEFTFLLTCIYMQDNVVLTILC